MSKLRALEHVWSIRQGRGENFAACFSTDGDSLSQWRAYADDGRGFAIGFYARALRRSGVEILNVLYDREEKTSEMQTSLIEYLARARSGSPSFQYESEADQIAARSVAFKNPAWPDEKEVRCAYRVGAYVRGRDWSISSVRTKDQAGAEIEIPVRFAARASRIVPYFDLPFDVSAIEGERPIANIMHGPKCPADMRTICFLMSKYGYSFVNQHRAGAAYR